MIYLDHAAATKPVFDAQAEFDYISSMIWGNPNSAHAAGEEAREALEAARAKILRLIGANSGELHFFPTATAAAQTAIYSAVSVGYASIRYDTEHHSVGDSTYIQWRICENTAANGYFLHCRMLANNEVGEIYGKPDLKPSDLWLCDATAALGHIPVNVEQLGCDYLIGDALKFGGIPGAAFLYVAPDAPFFPLIEGGTPSVALACAMAASLEWQTEHMEENRKKISFLRDIFCEQFRLNFVDYILNCRQFPSERQLPHILNVSFPGVDGKALALLLSKEGICVSAGAACTTGDNAPSHVLMAMYNDEARARSAIRISLSHENTAAECEQAAKKIAACVEHLRAIG